jgi:hypothetical protein
MAVRMVERMSPWAKLKVELSNLLFHIGSKDRASDQQALSIQPCETQSYGADCWPRTRGEQKWLADSDFRTS